MSKKIMDCVVLETERLAPDVYSIWLDAGEIFGPEGALFERINLATQRAVVEEAMDRLQRAFEDLN